MCLHYDVTEQTCMRPHMSFQMGTLEVRFAAVFKVTNMISSSICLAVSITAVFLLILRLQLCNKPCLGDHKISL